MRGATARRDDGGSAVGRDGVEAQVTQHLPLVRAVAARLYRARWNDALPFEEYVQMGTVGLLEAARRFDAGRGVPFGAFASWRIAGAILNGLERATEQHQQVAARRALVAERVASVGSDEGAAAERSLEGRLARLAAVAVGLAVGFMLEGSGLYSIGAELTPHDGCALLATRQRSHLLRAAVQALPAQERCVLESHYFEHRAFADIAAALNLTRGRVSQIHRRGIERLRDRLRADDVVDGFDA